jgi:hypothetical protein
MAIGRPTKLTEELTAQVVETIKRSNHPETAALACGISRASYYDWKRKGENGEEPYASFWTEVTRAIAASEVQLVDAAQRGDAPGVGYGDSKAALEVLKLRFAKRWSPQVKLEIADQLNRYLDVAQRVLDDASFRTLLDALAEDAPTEEVPELQTH